MCVIKLVLTTSLKRGRVTLLRDTVPWETSCIQEPFIVTLRTDVNGKTVDVLLLP